MPKPNELKKYDTNEERSRSVSLAGRKGSGRERGKQIDDAREYAARERESSGVKPDPVRTKEIMQTLLKKDQRGIDVSGHIKDMREQTVYMYQGQSSDHRAESSRSEIPPAREGYIRFQAPDRSVHFLPIDNSIASNNERLNWYYQWNATHYPNDHLDATDLYMMRNAQQERTNNGWISLDSAAIRQSLLVEHIRGGLQHNYENTVREQEQIIRELYTGITRENPQLSGRVEAILTEHGRAYQDSMNPLNSQVVRGIMDQATRDNYEIPLRANLYAGRITDLKKLRDDLSQ